MKNYKIFKNKYVLIEDAKRKCQPFFKEYLNPPRLSLNLQPLGCPFQENKIFKSGYKKKTSKPGFCEVCYSKFQNYDLHVKEYEHREFANDCSNYEKIDQFIYTSKFCEDKEENLFSSPLAKFTGNTQICDYEQNYNKILQIGKINTDNSEDSNDTVQFNEWFT